MKKIGTLLTLLVLFLFNTTALAKPAKTHRLIGEASYYAEFHHGHKTANGEIFNMHALTAAHRTLPLGTKIKVTNLKNGKTVYVRVNDRGPYAKGRILDLSKEAANRIGMIKSGVAKVRIELI